MRMSAATKLESSIDYTYPFTTVMKTKWSFDGGTDILQHRAMEGKEIGPLSQRTIGQNREPLGGSFGRLSTQMLLHICAKHDASEEIGLGLIDMWINQLWSRWQILADSREMSSSQSLVRDSNPKIYRSSC